MINMESADWTSRCDAVSFCAKNIREKKTEKNSKAILKGKIFEMEFEEGNLLQRQMKINEKDNKWEKYWNEKENNDIWRKKWWN